MKSLFCFSILVFFLASCAPKFMQEIMDNQYFEKTVYEDPKALYIGEWTAATPIALTTIKINEKGNIKMCTSNPHFGSSNGKVFKENGKIKMIFESGAQYEILSMHNDFFIVDYHGHEYKFYSGKVPDNCRDIFDKFVSQ